MGRWRSLPEGHDHSRWNRITFQNLETTATECSNLPVDFRRIYQFKARFAQHYDKTYRRILEKLIAGPLLHIDETKVNLLKGSCYVWVFTNMEEVAFVLGRIEMPPFCMSCWEDSAACS